MAEKPVAKLIHGQLWPGTVWEPDRKLEDERAPLEGWRCRNCARTWEFHGASEIVTRRLELPLKQHPYVCPPEGVTLPNTTVPPPWSKIDLSE